ncbi:MAG: type II toxin-antitoxin system RelE/ParE family toxin [Clostridium sp.]|jgi:plasmid stabilization system protein ParE|nr:type II toxin-antitoxin system RelE/ParE family toxin [Clostridium sp.]
MESKYSLRFIPRFEADLNEIIDYIVFKLHNPDSAIKLINKVEDAILKRLDCPLAFEPFQSNRKRKNLYYRIYVDNFVICYVVIGKVMGVRRILYKGRNAGNLIK